VGRACVGADAPRGGGRPTIGADATTPRGARSRGTAGIHCRGPPSYDHRVLPALRFISTIGRALSRARFGIVTVGAAYVVSAAVGMAMVHGGSSFALGQRDRLVSRASATSSILQAFRHGNRWTAAALDAGGNLVGAAASTLAGYWAPAVYPLAIYRGWIGGIVGVDRHHRSRLVDAAERRYYLVTLLLQLLPYTLAGGAGVTLGRARVRPVGAYAGPRIAGLPVEALRDAARIYVLVVPLFAIASSFEFLAR
jgi:hypothetical protein